MALPPNNGKFIPIKNVPEPDEDGLRYEQDGDLVTPEKAKKVIKAFLIDEIGSYIEHGFRVEKDSILEKIDKEYRLLNQVIDNKIDKVAEEIVSKLISSKVEDEIKRRVTEKLEAIKNSL